MQPGKQKVAWVTGASSGIGRSLALQLARDGTLVIASARNAEALEALASEHENIRALACDITDRDSLAAIAEPLSAIAPAVDQAILNAGNCEYLDFPEPDWDAARRVMEVNYLGTVNCVEFVLPLLRASEARRPQLAVIASQVTAAPFPRAEAYGASKAAVQYFCESLRLDLAAENIDVSVVNPGFVDTPLTRKNDFDMPFLMDADVAAKRIVARLAAHPRRYSFPKRLSALLYLSKLAPGLWQKMVAPKNKSNSPQQARN